MLARALMVLLRLALLLLCQPAVRLPRLFHACARCYVALLPLKSICYYGMFIAESSTNKQHHLALFTPVVKVSCCLHIYIHTLSLTHTHTHALCTPSGKGFLLSLSLSLSLYIYIDILILYICKETYTLRQRFLAVFRSRNKQHHHHCQYDSV